MARKEYSEASQLLDSFTFEYTVFHRSDEQTRFYVADVRARSLTEAKHLVSTGLAKEGASVSEWVRTYHHGRDRSWLREGHKQYFPQVIQTRQFDRPTYERLLKERNEAYAI